MAWEWASGHFDETHRGGHKDVVLSPPTTETVNN